MATFSALKSVRMQEDGAYHCTIDADTDGDGILENVDFVLTPNDKQGIAPQVREAVEKWVADNEPVGQYVSPDPTRFDVNFERDSRIESGFSFNGGMFDFDIKSKTNISGAAQLAFMAIVAGAPEGFLKWHQGEDDFAWIAADNTSVPMDAQTVVAFGQAAANHERAHIIAAKALKDVEVIPSDYQDDKYWP